MDFFEHQASARRRTTLLVFYFVIAVVLIVVLVLALRERRRRGADEKQGTDQRCSKAACGEMAGHGVLHLYLHRPRTIRAVACS